MTTVRTLAVVTAGTRDPSTTTMLANQIAAKTIEAASARGIEISTGFIDLRAIAVDVANALVTHHVSDELRSALDTMRDADALIAATPVYKAGASGLFTSFFQVLDNDLLIGTPTVLAGTAGSDRHALVVDDQLRGLFAYLRTVTTPTSVFAGPDDWNDGSLSRRAGRAATELVSLIESDFRGATRGEAWTGYQHSFGSAGGAETAIGFDTDLMRLATGGAA